VCSASTIRVRKALKKKKKLHIRVKPKKKDEKKLMLKQLKEFIEEEARAKAASPKSPV